MLQTAAGSSGRVAINYHKLNGEFHQGRCIRPRRIFRKDGHVYCEAFCELRADTRHFRIDRISGIGQEGEAVGRPDRGLVLPQEDTAGRGGSWSWVIWIVLGLIFLVLLGRR